MDWRLVAELEVERAAGEVDAYARFSVEEDGVAEEWAWAWEWWPASTLSSVRKLALERRRKSERNEGAMAMEHEFSYLAWDMVGGGELDSEKRGERKGGRLEVGGRGGRHARDDGTGTKQDRREAVW